MGVWGEIKLNEDGLRKNFLVLTLLMELDQLLDDKRYTVELFLAQIIFIRNLPENFHTSTDNETREVDNSGWKTNA